MGFLENIFPFDGNVRAEDVESDLFDVLDHLKLGFELASAVHDPLDAVGGGEDFEAELSDFFVGRSVFKESF